MASLGLEARHSWRGGAALLGDLTAFPHIKIDSIEGLRKLGDFDAPAGPAVNRRGEAPLAGERAGKTVVYSGRVRARSLDSLRTKEDTFLAAFEDTAEADMVITPHPSYAAAAGVQRTFRARCVDLEVPDEQVYSFNRQTMGFERDFTLALRLADPRVFDVTAKSADAGGAVAAATNLATNPRAGAGLAAPWVNASFSALTPVAGLAAAPGLPRGVDTGFSFGGSADGHNAYLPVTVTSGLTYTFSVYILTSLLTGGAAVDLQVRDAAGIPIADSANISAISGAFTRLSVTVVASGGGTPAWRLVVRQVGAGGSGGYISAAQVEVGGAATEYHDGDLPQSGWTGAAHASTSTRRAYKPITAVNGGTVDTDPVFTVLGQGTLLGLRHRGLDRYLGLSNAGAQLLAGQSLVVDFGQRTIRLNGVLDAGSYLDRAVSDWWDEGIPGLLPGSNTIEVYRTGAAEASVAWRDAFAA